MGNDAGRGSFLGGTGERGELPERVPVLRVERVEIAEVSERVWVIAVGVVVLAKPKLSEPKLNVRVRDVERTELSDTTRFRDNVAAGVESVPSCLGESSKEAEDLFEKERLSVMTAMTAMTARTARGRED